jgi:hypothetical protein
MVNRKQKVEFTGGFMTLLAIFAGVLLLAYLIAPLKLFSIHSELQKIRKLLEAELQQQQNTLSPK